MCSSDAEDGDLHGLTASELLDRTRALVAERNRIDAELARTVRVADNRQAFAGDGMATAQSWLRGHCRLSGAAAQVVRNGRVLEQLPAVAAAHAAGELTADQVAVIARITGRRPAALIAQRDGDLAGIAGVLARFAAGHKHEELVRLVHTLLERLDEDGPEPDPTEERFLSFAEHADGSGTGRFHLDALGMEKLQAAIESILQAHRPAGDARTQPQRNADALVQLADIHLGCGTLPLLRTVKPHVAVKIGSADLADPAVGRGAAEAMFGGVVSAARARQVACDAELRRYLCTADGELLDLGRGPAAGARAEHARRGGQRGPFIRRLRGPALLVRGSSRDPLAVRRRDRPGELRAAVRAAPHPGAPRLPHRARYRRPMAHLPPRRHRDPGDPANRRRPEARPRRLIETVPQRACVSVESWRPRPGTLC